MCLDLNSNTQLQIAEEDIICYKTIFSNGVSITTPHAELHGKEFQGVIAGIKTNGAISAEPGRPLYFYTNDPRLCGSWDNDTFNQYEYAYVRDESLTSLIVDGVEITKKGYVTPYRYFPVEIGKTYHSELIREDNEVNIGLHSYKFMEDARLDTEGYIIVKCIIPKGSEYYEGVFWDEISYASNCLQYVEII